MVIGLATVLCLGQTALAGVSLLSADAFVRLSVDSQDLVLPAAAPQGAYQGEVRFNAYVYANCRHLVCVSFDGFKTKWGNEIRPEDTFVEVDGKSIPVGSISPVPVCGLRGAAKGGSDIPINLNLRVNNMKDYPAGKYEAVVEVLVLGEDR
ncbi:hypothetical protein ACFL6U_24155 [Planctomycetota bacterium]